MKEILLSIVTSNDVQKFFIMLKQEVEQYRDNDFQLTDTKFSTCFRADQSLFQGVEYSALLTFEKK